MSVCVCDQAASDSCVDVVVEVSGAYIVQECLRPKILKCLEEREDDAESQYDPDNPDPAKKYRKSVEDRIHRHHLTSKKQIIDTFQAIGIHRSRILLRHLELGSLAAGVTLQG